MKASTTIRAKRSQSTLTMLLATALSPFAANAQDLTTTKLGVELRANEIERRITAIDQLSESTDPTAERLLQPLLKDKDWEVQECVARALGKLQSKSSLPKLVELAVEGDIARVRRAAAFAAAAIDAPDACKRIFKLVKGKRQVDALESLALVLRGQPAFADADKLEKLLTDKEALVREAAAVAWLEAAANRASALQTLASSQFLAVRCRALDAIAEAPRPGDIDPLAALFGGAGQNEVVARRIVRALAAALTVSDGDRAAKANGVLDGTGDTDITLARRARLVPMLASGEKPVLDQKAAVAALLPCLRAPVDTARAAAAKSLREIGGADALAAALKQFGSDPAARVQWQLVETVATLREPTTPEAVEWLTKIARGDYDSEVRERAVVRLGRSGVKGATDTLVEALEDRRWTIAVCAAVSLGKTDADDAFGHLEKLLDDPDWKLRGAAIVGLMHWSRDAAVDPLLKMLDDKHPVVARAAHDSLRTLSRNFEAPQDAKAWRKWWADNRQNHDFTDREASLDKLKKYGYAVPDSEIYKGLDVIVFQSPLEGQGDHIEQLLDRLEIKYRTTQPTKVPGDGLHPESIFVSNCTGRLGPDDVEPLAWFVSTGGSLFGSCWALSETIARIQPGIMQLFRTPAQVLDDVRARPVDPDSPLLTGVFPAGVVPVYHLEGAHLIQVLDQDRCEVLIDSPDAAERHGCGNLAAWFFSGHGVMFDSVNHFDLQGLGVAGAGALKDATARQAYAVDHLGMSLATWRDARMAGYWKNNSKASENVPDLSAFRLLTNFVRSKRIGAY